MLPWLAPLPQKSHATPNVCSASVVPGRTTMQASDTTPCLQSAIVELRGHLVQATGRSLCSGSSPRLKPMNSPRVRLINLATIHLFTLTCNAADSGWRSSFTSWLT